VFDPTSNDNFDQNGDFQSPNPLLKQYIEQSKAFEYTDDSVQTLINFANGATKAIANVGTLFEKMMEQSRIEAARLKSQGLGDLADKVQQANPRLAVMNDDLKVLCLSINAISASLILTAKKAEQYD
jgi:hypothetical protein